MDSKPVNVLWTSGWDSTFRVLSLLTNTSKTVQPWYVADNGRRSTKVELHVMDKIRETLLEGDSTLEQRFLPPIIIPIEDIPTNLKITNQYNELLQRSWLGSQYDWLSRLAHWKGIELELSIHRDDKAHDFLQSAIERMEDGTYRLAPTGDGALTLFSPFIFPLFDMTKVQMQAIAAERGFTNIMEMTWFCFNPLLDKTPCGRCNPCKYTAEEGMGRRIPPPSFVRTAQAIFLAQTWRIRNKARRLSHLLK